MKAILKETRGEGDSYTLEEKQKLWMQGVPKKKCYHMCHEKDSAGEASANHPRVRHGAKMRSVTPEDFKLQF